MAQAKVVKTVNANADEVFALLGDFAGIQAGGPVEAVRFEGEGVGMLRYITMGGGEVIERLETHDAQSREFSYVILNDDSPLPFANYRAQVNVADNGDGTCTVDWQGDFDAQGDEAQAISVATGIYAGGIKGAKIALEPEE